LGTSLGSATRGPGASEKERECYEADKATGRHGVTRQGCEITLNINCRGDVNIYNCSAPSGEVDDCDSAESPCNIANGECIPVVAGAKHKLSRTQRLDRSAAHARIPSALAAGTLHMLRRFLSGKAPASAMEASVFAVFSNMPQTVKDVTRCASSAYEDLPVKQRDQLFGAISNMGLDTPLTAAALSDAWAKELTQRLSQQLFGDPQALDQPHPGKIRVYEPQGEDFFSQVRICSINSLRTANFIPSLNAADFLPAEIQQDCAPVVVNGQTQVVCQVRTADCPGNSGPGFCARVQDIAPGDSLLLQGVNYFSVNAKVRLTMRATGSPTRDVEAFVMGDDTTPVTDSAGALINDCRVQDRITFRVPDDLPAGVYEMEVVVPNVTGIASLGDFMISNAEFINLLPPANARFNIVAETINAREETSPSWFGSDEVGLHTMSTSLLLDGTLSALPPLETQFQGDFDSGDWRDITRNIFEQQEPLKALILVVTGFEIDSQHAYDQMITSVSAVFWDATRPSCHILRRRRPHWSRNSAGGGCSPRGSASRSWRQSTCSTPCGRLPTPSSLIRLACPSTI